MTNLENSWVLPSPVYMDMHTPSNPNSKPTHAPQEKLLHMCTKKKIYWNIYNENNINKHYIKIDKYIMKY